MSGKKKKRKNRRPNILSETLRLNPEDTLFLHCDGPIAIKGAPGNNAVIRGTGDLRWTRKERQIEAWLDGRLAVSVPRATPLRLQLDGPVSLKDSAGSIEVLAADGPLNVANVQGNLRIEAIDGPATLKNIGGDIAITQGDGPIFIKHCRGDVDVTSDDPIFVQLSGDKKQKIRIHSDEAVNIQLPAATAVAGRIKAGGHIKIELAQQTADSDENSITLTPATGLTPAVALNIEADGDVYVGPNPPDMSQPASASGFRRMGVSWLGTFFGRQKGTSPRTVVTPPPEPESSDDDLAAAQKVVLQMVAEGKISAEEGDKLLEALS